MKSVLLIASVASMISKFNMDNIKILLDLGYRVTVATNFVTDEHSSVESIEKLKDDLVLLGVESVQIDFSRSVINMDNHLQAYKQVFRLLNKRYDVIHTHTPIASAIVRVANKLNKKSNSNVIYTAHGFHFYSGAPIINWIIYYPIEKILSRYTDVLLTINKEDFERTHKFDVKQSLYIPGVGVNINIPKLTEKEIEVKKNSLGLNKKIVLISVGELNDNKNHRIVLEALSKIEYTNYKYIIVGEGPNRDKLLNMISEFDLNDKVELLGYRNDVQELLQISNIFIFPSFREGLSKSLMEAMAVGLPAIVSKIRGNTDLILENQGGYLFNPNDWKSLQQQTEHLLTNESKRSSLGVFNENIVQEFSNDVVNKKMKSIYYEFLKNGGN